MTDGIKYALLVSVGKYDMEDITDLPTYKEDIKLMSESLINGLGFLSENIRSVGEDGKVNVQSFTYAIKNFKLIKSDKNKKNKKNQNEDNNKIDKYNKISETKKDINNVSNNKNNFISLKDNKENKDN